MKISVAMATYNGIRYIKKQLDSLLWQTLQPDEIIISDDGSTDGTVELIKDYISKHQLNNWIILYGGEHLGWRENFRRAISRTTGDIVFFADQDDIWKKNKIKQMSHLMKKYDMGCLYGRHLIIDGKDNRLRSRDEQRLFSGRLLHRRFSPNFYQINPLGCCMAVNRRIIDRYLDLNLREDDHDSQCLRIALLYDSLYILDRPVIYYRIHGSNTTKASNKCQQGASDIKSRIKEIDIKRNWLLNVKEDDIDLSRKKAIIGGLTTENMRKRYLCGDIGVILPLLLRLSYYEDISQLVGDFAYKYGLNRVMGEIYWRWKKLVHKAH